MDIVYEKLREEIMSGVFKPGDRLIISQIARQFEISDIPVREAVRILESEDLIKILPNVGPIVTEFKEEDILDYFTIRGVLEGYAARLSIDYLEPEHIARLENIIGLMKVASEKHNLIEYGILNKKFHCTMYEVIPFERYYRMITELWEKWERTRSVFMISPERTIESNEEHKEILNLAKQKKYNELEMYVRQHKLMAAERLITSLK